MGIKKLVRNRIIHSNVKWVALVGDIIKRLYVRLIRSRLGECLLYKPNLNDRDYIIQKYQSCFGVAPDLDHPKNFNEKNNWRKLNDRRDIYTQMVDKYGIKTIVANRVGEKYAFPLLGVWNRPEDIDFSKLPNQFVLKVNHAGGVIVCRDKSTFDISKAIKELRQDQRINYYIFSREWPYKNVQRKIICEQYMGENLTDYKNYCFDGKLHYTFVWENQSREDGRKPQAYFCGAYDQNWKKSGLEIDYPSRDVLVEKPKCYEEMVRIAEAMSAGIPFVRVDCYIINDHVYVGEMTFFPWGGFMKFKDEKWNQMLGDLEKLPLP